MYLDNSEFITSPASPNSNNIGASLNSFPELVSCNYCTKPVIKASFLGHLENCKTIKRNAKAALAASMDERNDNASSVVKKRKAEGTFFK